MLKVNLAAPMRLVRLLGPSMAKKGNAVIINISSIAGIDPMPVCRLIFSKVQRKVQQITAGN